MERPTYELNELWGPIRSILSESTFSRIKRIAGLAGINMTALAHLTQQGSSPASKDTLLSAIDAEIGRMDAARREIFIRAIAEEMTQAITDVIEKMNDRFRRMGWCQQRSDASEHEHEYQDYMESFFSHIRSLFPLCREDKRTRAGTRSSLVCFAGHRGAKASGYLRGKSSFPSV